MDRKRYYKLKRQPLNFSSNKEINESSSNLPIYSTVFEGSCSNSDEDENTSNETSSDVKILYATPKPKQIHNVANVSSKIENAVHSELKTYDKYTTNQSPRSSSEVRVKYEDLKPIKILATSKQISKPSTSQPQAYGPQIIALLKDLAKEVQLIRMDINDLRNQVEKVEEVIPYLDLPKKTVGSFLEFESDVKTTPDIASNLELKFNGVTDQSATKFVKGCLKFIVVDSVASNFSWYGLNNNIAVKDFAIMDIIKNVTLKKFPETKVADVIVLIKKWFQYAKDRTRKSVHSKVETVDAM